jgi:UTP-glucose-1-phosphate uridylyltransferase
LHATGELEITDGFRMAIQVAPGVRAVRFGGEIYDCGTPEAYADSTAHYPTSPADPPL